MSKSRNVESPIKSIERVVKLQAREDVSEQPRSNRRNERLKVAWRSCVFDPTENGDRARALLLPMIRRMAQLRIDDADCTPNRVTLGEKEEAVIQTLMQTRLDPPYIEVINQEPQMFHRNELAFYRVARTASPLPMLPQFWINECNAMDELWLPSSYCCHIFAESGIKKEKVRLVPEPVDLSIFQPFRGTRDRGGRNSPVRLLSVLEFAKEKGWDKLLEAYVQEFTADDDVELVLRIFWPGKTNDEIVQKVLEFLKMQGIAEERRPPIVFLDDSPLGLEQMRDLYLSADVMIAPTRGEGFGRAQLEALACGVPVITTGWGGQTDFVTEENGWLLDYKLCLRYSPDNPEFQGSFWADPDVEHLRQCMREAVEDEELRRSKGAKGPETAARYDQELIADQVLERLEEIEAEHAPKPVKGKAVSKPVTKPWVMMTSPHERCGIREYTRRLMEAGLSEHMTMISAPDLFRNFKLDAELIHLQYHSVYINPHQFLHHPPSCKLVATLHDLHRFEEISHLFDAIIVHNSRDYGKVRAMPRKEGGTVEIIPYGCCKPAAEEYLPSRRIDPVIAFHGFAHADKGLRELIFSFAQLRRRFLSSRLLILSTFHPYFDDHGRSLVQDCERIVSELGLRNSISFVNEFLSPEQIVHMLHEKADLIVLPYSAGGNSSSSGAARIAMASARPVIVTDIPIFRDLKNQVVKFPTSEMLVLSEIIGYVWKNRLLQRMLVKSALQLVSEQAWPVVADKTKSLYRRLIDGAASDCPSELIAVDGVISNTQP